MQRIPPGASAKLAAVWTLMLFALTGCGGPKTHTINGRIEHADGDIQALVGSNIEAVREDDATIRASGVVEEDGSFKLETLREGSIVKGAPAGIYQVRLILPDDDRNTSLRAARSINARYLAFESSGLRLQVPSTGQVRLTVSAR